MDKKDQYIQKMKDIQKRCDNEFAVYDANMILLSVLRDHGYQDLIEEYKKVNMCIGFNAHIIEDGIGDEY